jgi:hypothetical protein
MRDRFFACDQADYEALAAAFAKAIADEQERCARVAEAYADKMDMSDAHKKSAPWAMVARHEGHYFAGNNIANSIRGVTPNGR